MNVHRHNRSWLLVSMAWLAPAILGTINTVVQQQLSGSPIAWVDALFSAIDWLLYGVLTPFVMILSRRFPLVRPALWRNAALHVMFGFLLSFAWAAGGTLLKVMLQPGDIHNVSRWYLGWVFTTFPFGVAVYLSIVGAEHALRYFVEAREREAQVAKLSEQLTGARLAALEARLNPHFLFNSLNTVSVLVRDGDNRAASRVIEQLSEVLRTTLNQARDSEVSLADELDLVRLYLAVEQARFSDRLQPSIEVTDDLLAAAVPGFALQHLVENAIRHGIAKRSDAGRIAVTARLEGSTLVLSVEDDGGGLEGHGPAAGHGLENTRERLQTLYGAAASLAVADAAPKGVVATLRVPYHELVLGTVSA